MRWLSIFRGESADDHSPPPVRGEDVGFRRFASDPSRMFDLERTSTLSHLLAAEPSRRDDAWSELFYNAAWHASVELAAPAVFEGPDGFPYLRLQMPTPGAPFKANALGNLADQAVERATGVALFASPKATEPAFVFPMGVLDSMLRFDSWRGDPQDLAELADHPPAADDDGVERLTVSAGREVLVGTPSADYLPPASARALHHHLAVGWGMKDPRVSLLLDPAMAPTRNLMLSRSFEEFPRPELRAAQIRMLLWYLPPRRSLLLRPESTRVETMTPLSQLFPAVPS